MGLGLGLGFGFGLGLGLGLDATGAPMPAAAVGSADGVCRCRRDDEFEEPWLGVITSEPWVGRAHSADAVETC